MAVYLVLLPCQLLLLLGRATVSALRGSIRLAIIKRDVTLSGPAKAADTSDQVCRRQGR